MRYAHTVGGRTYTFDGLRELLAKASPARSGDYLAEIAAGDDEERIAAQMALAEVPLATFLIDCVVPYESDEVTRLIIDEQDKKAFSLVSHLTVGGFRDWLLSDAANEKSLASLAPGLTPEIVAAVSKISRVQDLVLISQKCRVVTKFRNSIGLKGRLSNSSPAQSSDGRSDRHSSQHCRRPDVWKRRRRNRHKSCDR